jgi:hypothetical protein
MEQIFRDFDTRIKPLQLTQRLMSYPSQAPSSNCDTMTHNLFNTSSLIHDFLRHQYVHIRSLRNYCEQVLEEMCRSLSVWIPVLL